MVFNETLIPPFIRGSEILYQDACKNAQEAFSFFIGQNNQMASTVLYSFLGIILLFGLMLWRINCIDRDLKRIRTTIEEDKLKVVNKDRLDELFK